MSLIKIDKEELENFKQYLPYLIIIALSYVCIRLYEDKQILDYNYTENLKQQIVTYQKIDSVLLEKVKCNRYETNNHIDTAAVPVLAK